jgi:hypothetical protein
MSKIISGIENDTTPIGAVNRLVADSNAWALACNARRGKANKILAEINAEGANAKPPSPGIPLIPLLEPLAFVELPAVPDPAPPAPLADPGSAPPPRETEAAPALSIESPQPSAADIKGTVRAFMEGGKGKPTTGGGKS